MIYQNIHDQRLKPPKTFENWVKDFFPVYEFVSKEQTFLSSNRKKERTKRQLRSNTNFKRLSQNKYFTIILSTSKRIEYQIYRVFFEINEKSKKEEFYFVLYSMLKLENDVEVGIYTDSFGKFRNYKKGFRKINYGGFRYADDGEIYPFTDETFKNSELKYVQNISGLITPKHWNSRLNERLSRVYKYRNGIESIQRLGGYLLAEEIASDMRIVDMRTINKNFILSNRKHITNNSTYSDLLFFEECRNQGIPENKEYTWVLGVNELTGLTIHKEQHSKTRLLNYLVKQGKSLRYYNDYLDMLEQLGIPAEERIVFYPRDLRLAHDDLVERINILDMEDKLTSNADLDKKAKRIHKVLSKLEYTGPKYSVVAPKGLKDILVEGKELNHCVGSSNYLKGHANKDFAIMFLRDKEEKSKPLITFTYHYDGRVTSIHGYGNKNNLEYLDEAKEFIKNDWLEFVSRKGKDETKVLSKI